MDKFKHLQTLTDEKLCEHTELCVFTQGTRKVRSGEPHRCKQGHITFISQTGINNVFASMRAMKRKDAQFTVSIYGDRFKIKTGTYDFQARKTKGLLDKLDRQEKTKPCAVCFAINKCMGTARTDLDTLMTACPVKLLVKEKQRRTKVGKQKKSKHVCTLAPEKSFTCFFGKTCARLLYGKDCKSGCPHQQKYEQQMARKLWQEKMQRKMEQAEADRILEEKQKKEKQELQEKKKREKEIRKRIFFATRIQKVIRGFLVRKYIKAKPKGMWYTDLLSDLPNSGNWDDILHQLTLVEFDSEELLRDASEQDLMEALRENNIRLRVHKARYLLKKVNERMNGLTLLPLNCDFMKPALPPGFTS